MDALRRNQYLQTMGVDVWVSRRSAAAAILDPVALAVGPDVARADSLTSAAAHAGSRSAVHVVGADIGVAAAGSVRPPPANIGVAPTRAPPAGATADAASAVPVSLPVARGADASPGVTTWESLRSEVLACTKCALHGSRTQGVFGVGNREAQWLVVGEAPGAEEDRRGEPFVGRAGHLLDAMLKAIGLSRGRNVYIANVLKSRPPGNRDPKPEEVAACLPYLMRQIELLRPRVMLAVGRIAAQNLLATDVPLGRLRGKVHHFGELNTPLIVTYHPAYLLRTPGDKRKAWEDLKFARSVFQGLNPTQ
jgi:DNA polymerase